MNSVDLRSQFAKCYGPDFPSLMDSIDLEALKKGGTHFDINLDQEQSDEEEEAPFNVPATTHVDEQTLTELQGEEDEDANGENSEDFFEAFEILKKKMKDLSGDRGVCKRITRPGSGEIIPKTSLARVHYQVFQEYADEPYDSSRLRGRPISFRLFKDQVISGMDIGVQTMRKGECAKFLISPEYNIGALGCPPRLPRDATVLMEIELLGFSDNAATDEYYSLPFQERRSCSIDIIKNVMESLRNETRAAFKVRQFKSAFHYTKQSIDILEERHLQNAEDEEYQKSELVTLFLNAALCNIKLKKYHTSVTYSKSALMLEKSHAKAYYLKGVALMNLSDFVKARVALNKACELESSDGKIRKAIINLNKLEKKYVAEEKHIYKKMLSGAHLTPDEEHVSQRTPEPSKISPGFEELAISHVDSFLNDKDSFEIDFPHFSLSIEEVMVVLQIAEKNGLGVREVGSGNDLKYRLFKKKT